jgi:small subunit ribosomal protein S8
MTTSDPIADMLTRIRNAMATRHAKVDVPIVEAENGHRQDPEGRRLHCQLQADRRGNKKSSAIYLKYTPRNVPVISRIERVSRPGCRVYVGSKEVPRVLGGLGINILTTPRGVMTGSSARNEGRRRRSAVSRLVEAGRGERFLCLELEKN